MTRRTSIALAATVAAAMTLPFAAEAQTNSQWEGFYAGLNAGGLWSSTSASIVENNTGGGFNGTGSGFVGGAQAGYNYLLGPGPLGGGIHFQGAPLSGGGSGGGRAVLHQRQLDPAVVLDLPRTRGLSGRRADAVPHRRRGVGPAAAGRLRF